MSEELNLIADMKRSLEFYDMEECDPDVANLLDRATHILEKNPPVDPDWVESIRQANLVETTR